MFNFFNFFAKVLLSQFGGQIRLLQLLKTLTGKGIEGLFAQAVEASFAKAFANEKALADLIGRILRQPEALAKALTKMSPEERAAFNKIIQQVENEQAQGTPNAIQSKVNLPYYAQLGVTGIPTAPQGLPIGTSGKYYAQSRLRGVTGLGNQFSPNPTMRSGVLYDLQGKPKAAPTIAKNQVEKYNNWLQRQQKLPNTKGVDETGSDAFQFRTESRVLSSSWLVHGYYQGNGISGIITITTIKGMSYTFTIPIDYNVWNLMKGATGRNGTGAGSVFWRFYYRAFRVLIKQEKMATIFEIAGVRTKKLQVKTRGQVASPIAYNKRAKKSPQAKKAG